MRSSTYTTEELKKEMKRQGTFEFGECMVMVGLEAGWHMSISHRSRLPTYDEIKGARYKLLPDDVYMAQIFPPEKEFVNVHPYCLHLWEVDG